MTRLEALTEEQKEVLFAWDPNVDKLTEMPVDEIEELATRLLADHSRRPVESG